MRDERAGAIVVDVCKWHFASFAATHHFRRFRGEAGIGGVLGELARSRLTDRRHQAQATLPATGLNRKIWSPQALQ